MNPQYKILNQMKACHGGEYTFVPGEWTPNQKPAKCRRGYHTVDADHLLEWLYQCDSVWECEVTGQNDGDNAKTAWESICITKQAMAFEDIGNLRADIAEHVLWIYEKYSAKDVRVRNCIAKIRRYAKGEITEDELSAADAAAYAAYADAADAAAAARRKEREWQRERLQWYLDGKPADRESMQS